MTIQTTVAELAAKKSWSPEKTRSIINVLIDDKQARIVGTKPANSVSGKGRGSHIYEIPTSATFNFE